MPSEQDLVKGFRSDFKQTLPVGLSDMAITIGDFSKITYWRN